jgi:hypothetical protein
MSHNFDIEEIQAGDEDQICGCASGNSDSDIGREYGVENTIDLTYVVNSCRW